MIKVDNITKYYGENLGVLNISFEVEENQVVGLLGRNGAGKTTTLNIITGYISSTEGNVKIDGFDILEDAVQAKAKIGYLPEKPPIYMDMTVNEYLDFCAQLKGVDKDLRIEHLDEICALTGVTKARGRLCRNLSNGYMQRVGIAQALVGNPQVLILDEPTMGLDPNQVIQIRQLIKSLGTNHTVIVSSHTLSEVEHICERVIIIDEGKIAADDTLENLMGAANKQNTIQLRLKNGDETMADQLGKADGVLSVQFAGQREKNTCDFMIEYKKHSNAREDIFNIVVKAGKSILMIKPIETTLEDVFLKITKERSR